VGLVGGCSAAAAGARAPARRWSGQSAGVQALAVQEGKLEAFRRPRQRAEQELNGGGNGGRGGGSGARAWGTEAAFIGGCALGKG
jgi:hypothetical protein